MRDSIYVATLPKVIYHQSCIAGADQRSQLSRARFVSVVSVGRHRRRIPYFCLKCDIVSCKCEYDMCVTDLHLFVPAQMPPQVHDGRGWTMWAGWGVESALR